MNQTIDPALCPVCNQPNDCAAETAKATGQPQPPCWCTQESFDPATLAALPPAAKGQACLCRACAQMGACALLSQLPPK